MRRWILKTVAALAVLAAAAGTTTAQPQRTGTAATPRAQAPIELTGYWISIVSEDWRFRMVTPPKGDYASVPLNAAARKVADAWDPARDEAAGLQCKAYGAPAVMRIPGRLHITWENDTTLRIDTEAGTQTRRLMFGPGPRGRERTWQGQSSAAWEFAGGRAGRAAGGSLKVTTTDLRPGYLRTNGVPYSANTVVTEHFNVVAGARGDALLIVTTIVEDPEYLNQPFITSTHFRREPDGSGWKPNPCAAR